MEAVNYLDWEDFLLVAAEATDLDVDQVGFIANRQLAESALGAPASGFGDCEQYPKFRYKVAILLERICKNHALRDGNKRTALLAAIHFANINGWEWVPPIADQQDGAETYEVVSAVAQSNVDIDALRVIQN